MEGGEDDDDLQLVKASAGLLAELESGLPKLLWKAQTLPPNDGHGRVHTRIKRSDLDRLVHLIEPFQNEPQLLDSHLRTIVHPIVDAYLQSLSAHPISKTEHLDLQTAVCSLLYTLCKVRGHKIILVFLNNEPRYLEPILEALERFVVASEDDQTQWQVPYILLLWLSHLLLTPFDLTSISTKLGSEFQAGGLENNLPELPALPLRIARIGLTYLSSATKAQDSAAPMLVRLAIRPDVQKFRLADHLIQARLPLLQESASAIRNMYEVLGSLRLAAGIVTSAELGHLVPIIYETCLKAFDEQDESALSSNAVAKKLVVKIFRNIAILSLHLRVAEGALFDFIQATDVLEDVIDYLLRSLGDKDTPVRYAAAKAISLVVVELEPAMGHEVIQAILDTFKEDLPRSASHLDFATVSALKWHGLTLALSHTLFRRSASPGQLPDILDALISALQFQQRTATGSTLGTNVRDAANFGLWSLSRRYTTAELQPVSASSLSKSNRIVSRGSVIEVLAIQLILAACLDPAGNIRRASSAALQELVGRHPDQVSNGILLVQIIDYQAVSLRTRAMADIANDAATLRTSYWHALLEALFGWRGLGSADVISRETAANAIARLAASPPPPEGNVNVLFEVTSKLRSCPTTDVEALHGLALAAALILDRHAHMSPVSLHAGLSTVSETLLPSLTILKNFSPRMLRSEVSVSLAKLLTSLCNASISEMNQSQGTAPLEALHSTFFDDAVERLLTRHEDSMLNIVPDMVKALLGLRRAQRLPLSCIGAQRLSSRVSIDGSKGSLHNAGMAVALGTLSPLYENTGLKSEDALTSTITLSGLFNAMNVDWRVVGAKAVLLFIDGASSIEMVPSRIAEVVCTSIHRGLNDYTTDERGDVGSLVRLQSIICASRIMSNKAFIKHEGQVQILQADILRLSLEKLDRVRLKAAQCRKEFLGLDADVTDVASISSPRYIEASLSDLGVDAPTWTHKALLKGCISCAGVGAEPLLQATRRSLALCLQGTDDVRLEQLLAIYVSIMKEMLTETANSQPALELLAFLLDMQIAQRLLDSPTFKWRTLLSTVQKLHHKSNDISKILAAVHVYVGMADVPTIKAEVLKKLVNMLKTNPYPRVRTAIAEALWLVTGDEVVKHCDWTRPVTQNAKVIEQLQHIYVAAV